MSAPHAQAIAGADARGEAFAILRRCHKALVLLRSRGHACSEDLLLDVEQALLAVDAEKPGGGQVERAGYPDGVFSGLRCCACGWWLRSAQPVLVCPICAAGSPR